MTCTDFIFDSETLSDHGYIICTFDGEISWSGGEVSFTTIKPPNSDKQVFYTSSQETPLSATFSICKNPCECSSQKEMCITQNDFSDIYRWLQRTDGYHWFQFIQDDFEDIYYNSMINLEPYFINGTALGFNVTLTTDSPYGYSQIIHEKFKLDDSNNCYILHDYSDKPCSTYINTTITPVENGDISIKTGNDVYSKVTNIKNVISEKSIILNGENDYICGISNPNHFNFEFPIIANTYRNRQSIFKKMDGVNCDVEIEYRYKRRVVV